MNFLFLSKQFLAYL